MEELKLQTERKTQLIDITDRVRKSLNGGKGTALLVYVPHTTAGVALRRQGWAKRPLAWAYVGCRVAGAHPAPRRCARPRSLPGDLPLRVRWAESTLGLCQRPAVTRRLLHSRNVA